MRDEQVGHAELLLEFGEEVDDLALRRHVQGAHGLVANDELGPNKDREPLSLPARDGQPARHSASLRGRSPWSRSMDVPDRRHQHQRRIERWAVAASSIK